MSFGGIGGPKNITLTSGGETIVVVDNMEATTGWGVQNTDTENLATTVTHVQGQLALTFDKANTAANSEFALIEKTLSTTLNVSASKVHDIVQTSCLVTSVSNILFMFVRLGTDSSNFSEWQVPVSLIEANRFINSGLSLGNATTSAQVGNGLIQSALSYVAVGFKFSSESNTLTGIIFDHVHIISNAHTTSNISSEVSSDVASQSVNVKKWGSETVSTNAGTVDAGTLRTIIASDQTVLPVSDNSGSLTVDDGGASLTVDDGGTTISVDDGGSSLTVDGTVAVTQSGDWNVSGDVAHDGVDAGNPVKTGGKAITIGADTVTGLDGPSQVAANDRTNALFDRQGYLHVRNWSYIADKIALTALNITYDDSPTFANSADINGQGFRRFTFTTEIVSANTPTFIRFKLQTKDSTGNYADVPDGSWGFFAFEDTFTSSAKNVTLRGQVPSATFRIRAEGTGTTASNTFILSDSEIVLLT